MVAPVSLDILVNYYQITQHYIQEDSSPLFIFFRPPTEWVPGTIYLGVKLPKREADHSPPSSAEVKKCGAIPPRPRVLCWRNA
jgi:hypothetical protein